ncbi:MAG: 1-deoxy-D-xylulose-5-phosphate reductoisomerase [Candidatus Competibacteraceae bacterium]|jgi:1-deoxy-D-xylulose-5-phosphate reductoisomerase|nr:1-deoxy-D-xylulose-5-phosphate reductoisomerase [Candidatus Competibacteraceae bacterium]
MIGVSILGSTGSIGVSTLAVLQQQRQQFQVVALSAHHRVDKLYQQCLEWAPLYAVVGNANAAQQLADRFRANGVSTQVLSGEDGLRQIAALPQAQYVMAAIVGAAGLLPTLEAVRAGKRVLLANKEALVLAGRLFMEAVRNYGATLLPIDSEHNAVFQCLPKNYSDGLAQTGVTRILLTGSGGPFRETPLAQLTTASPEQACAHPNWSMGRKISVDSATMMNKGLEAIEAHWLFNAEPEQIQVVVHPQSIIHSLVEYADGSLLAQLSNPDMRVPIAHALAWPKRMTSGVASLDLFQIGRLDFQPPDYTRFPCLKLAFAALQRGGTAAATLNAANEVAVHAFLEERLPFTAIAEVIEHTLERATVQEVTALQTVLDSDHQARQIAFERISALAAEA